MADPERRAITVVVARPFRDVEDFLRQRENWPRWATGLASGIERSGDGWIVHQKEGAARLRFLSDEPGYHDHVVTLADGQEVHVPLRAKACDLGTEVALELIRLPAMSREVFERDTEWVRRDLETLKRLLETAPSD